MSEVKKTSRKVSELGGVARRLGKIYAQALLDVASEQNQAEEVAAELRSLVVDVLNTSPDFEDSLASPVVKRKLKTPMLQQVFEGKTSPILFDFLNILNNHDRLNLIRAVEIGYRELLDEKAKRVHVVVKTATSLSADQLEHLKQSVGVATGREPMIVTLIDESLLGGMIVQVGDQLFDGSVRTRIENIRRSLLARSSYEVQVGRDRFSYSG
ncbi:MAG: ATP synthase F1 subunit delta [Zavarzinella sp.]